MIPANVQRNQTPSASLQNSSGRGSKVVDNQGSGNQGGSGYYSGLSREDERNAEAEAINSINVVLEEEKSSSKGLFLLYNIMLII